MTSRYRLSSELLSTVAESENEAKRDGELFLVFSVLCCFDDFLCLLLFRCFYTSFGFMRTGGDASRVVRSGANSLNGTKADDIFRTLARILESVVYWMQVVTDPIKGLYR